ncbi:protein kinase domain-containing protein [Dactylosporangium sp. CS-047395]|uniref:protein kinase domain-containing protein n=1 Tax=Dactylosporangium sp. CS-047395 TaxID=3239936 RepID=UPI003D940F0C
MTARAFPSRSDYFDALQHADKALLDPVLRAGELRVAVATGLPAVMGSGTFASVFQVTEAETGKRWAVKCFTQHAADQQERYEHVSAALAGLDLPELTGFEYLAEGIEIRGERYPILKMEWVEATSLMTWLEANYLDRDRVARLADEVLALAARLEAAGIAHGDLQHGNLLVAGDDGLRLIDYDGMFVPALAGRPANELGLPDYQSPRRTAADFGPGLDRFSAWSICTSLTALSVAPYLWETLRAQYDERLLLGAADYAAPGDSAALRTLRELGDPRVTELAGRLAEMCAADLAALPAPAGAGLPAAAVLAPAPAAPESAAAEPITSAPADDPLDEAAAKVAALAERVELRRALAAEDPGLYLASLAAALHTYGYWLAQRNRLAEALAATGEAVGIRRVLPDAAPADLASSLQNLGVYLARAGRFAEAAAAARDEVALRRDLPGGAGNALFNLALWLHRAGRPEEAIEVSGELLHVRYANAEAEPDQYAYALRQFGALLNDLGRFAQAAPALADALAAFRVHGDDDDVAVTLDHLAFTYGNLSRWAEAMTANDESLRIRATRPDTAPADTARQLHRRRVGLMHLGRPAEALVAQEAAIRAIRPAAAADPGTHWPALAQYLAARAQLLADAERFADLVDPATEAVAIGRQLVVDDPGQLKNLAFALRMLARGLSGTGKVDKAVQAASESILIERRLAQSDPQAVPRVAEAAWRLALVYSAHERWADAIRPGLETIAIRRNLAGSDPKTYLGLLAINLRLVGFWHASLNRWGDVLVFDDEAIAIRRMLAVEDPAGNLPALAGLLDHRSITLWRSGRVPEGVPVSAEAVAIWRRVAAADPEHLHDLGVSLGVWADRLNQSRRYLEAIQPRAEAVALRRRPGEDPLDLARNLEQYGYSCLRASSNVKDGLRATGEAVAILDHLAATGVRVPADRRHAAVENHACLLEKLGRHREAATVRSRG